MSRQSYTLLQLAEMIQAELRGDADKIISGVGTLKSANCDELSFLANKKYRVQLADTQSGVVLLDADEAKTCREDINILIHPNPYLAYAMLSQQFDNAGNSFSGVHATASIDESAVLGQGVVVGPNVVVEAGVTIGQDSQLDANVVIGANSVIGSRVKIKSNVSICHRVEIGDDVIIYNGAVIGSDGFGYAPNNPQLNKANPGRWQKIAQLGGVKIGNRVEIGANTTIDRGALDDTIIEDDVIIDNQVQIAHNVKVGWGSAIAGCVGIAGSTELGQRCNLGGGAGLAGHITIADDTTIFGMTMVSRSLKKSGVYASATTIQSVNDWRKNMIRVTQLEKLNVRIKQLEKNSETK